MRLAPPGWAWEFLRRNRSYARAVQTVPVEKLVLRRRPLLALVRSDAEDIAQRWGLWYPETPDRHYGRAAVFWHPMHDPSVLPVAASPVEPHTHASEVVDFRRLKIAVTVLQTQAAGEHVLLCDGLHAIQLHVLTGTVLEGPVQLSFKPAGMRVGKEDLVTLERFAAIRRSGNFSPREFKPHTNAERWLLALKIRQLLQSTDGPPDLLQLARTLFPAENVSHWSADTDWIRSRIRRAIQEGAALVDGGYLSMLKRVNGVSRRPSGVRRK